MMKFHLNFEGDLLRNQEKKILTKHTKILKKKLEEILGIKLTLEIVNSRLNKDKWHAFMRSKYGSYKHFQNLLKAIDGKVKKINCLGIDKITMWGLYEYEAQCNMEFNPKETLIIGKNNINFCISCWEKEKSN